MATTPNVTLAYGRALAALRDKYRPVFEKHVTWLVDEKGMHRTEAYQVATRALREAYRPDFDQIRADIRNDLDGSISEREQAELEASLARAHEDRQRLAAERAARREAEREAERAVPDERERSLRVAHWQQGPITRLDDYLDEYLNRAGLPMPDRAGVAEVLQLEDPRSFIAGQVLVAAVVARLLGTTIEECVEQKIEAEAV